MGRERHFRWIAAAAAVVLAAPAAAGDLPDVLSEIEVDGDLRVRYEANTDVEGGPEPHRGVLRFRLGASLPVGEAFEAGVRLVTGDPDNPRTADVTIGDLLNDLDVSLDRAWIRGRRGGASAVAGKFANPFRTTELVWDGDVNPQGIAGSYERRWEGGWSGRATVIAMPVDERAAGDDAEMWGGQLGASRAWSSGAGFEVAVAFWDYDLPGPVPPGEARGNNLDPDGGGYVSDFDLLDLVVILSLPGPAEEYPVQVTADVVTNLGAAGDDDRGFGVDVTVGREWRRGRPAFRYGYAECETDAVLGVFSHDNLPLATNYRNHTVRAAWGVRDDVALGLTWYYFRQLRDDLPGYRSRIRLDLMVRF